MNELKFCPFCGSKDINLYVNKELSNKSYIDEKGFVTTTPYLYEVGCAECGNGTMPYIDRKMAIAAWNKRFPEEHNCNNCKYSFGYFYGPLYCFKNGIEKSKEVEDNYSCENWEQGEG